jgi:hypothetical protein
MDCVVVVITPICAESISWHIPLESDRQGSTIWEEVCLGFLKECLKSFFCNMSSGEGHEYV